MIWRALEKAHQMVKGFGSKNFRCLVWPAGGKWQGIFGPARPLPCQILTQPLVRSTGFRPKTGPKTEQPRYQCQKLIQHP